MHVFVLGLVLGAVSGQETIPDPAPTLDFRDGCFRLSASRKSVELPLKSLAKKKLEALIEKSEAKIVVWDRRGLTIRSGKRSLQTKFEDYPVSAKLLEANVIRSNASKFTSGEYRRAAAGLSGSLRVGEKLYLLPRWEARNGASWLEALVEIDLSQDLPKPQLIGSYKGLSLGKGLIDHELAAWQDQIVVVTQSDSEWGVARYLTSNSEFKFEVVGSKLLEHQWRPDRLLFAEPTSYGMTVAGTYNLKSELRRDSIETRGLVSFLPLEADTALIRFKSTTYVRSMTTGAESRLVGDTSFMPTELGLMVYGPPNDPVRATIYDPMTWKPMVKWVRPAVGTAMSRQRAGR